MLIQRLAHLLASEAPHVTFTLEHDGADAVPDLVIRSPSAEVDSLRVCDEGEELTVFIGSFTHSHWGCSDESLSEPARQDEIVRCVKEYLIDVLEDRVVFFGYGAGGGSQPANVPRSFWSRLFLGRKSFRWSGPVAE
jgi:hypothetical protein